MSPIVILVYHKCTYVYFLPHKLQGKAKVMQSDPSPSSSACRHKQGCRDWGGHGLQLQWVDMEAPGQEAPLEKGEAVNYFYSLEMTYLIHSVSYLPSGLSSWTYESYKHAYFFIFGDRRGWKVRPLEERRGKGEEGWQMLQGLAEQVWVIAGPIMSCKILSHVRV